MSEAELAALWATVAPDARRRARIETRVFEWLEAGETSLVGEWLGLLKVDPVASLGFAAVGAVALVAFTPVGWITGWLLG